MPFSFDHVLMYRLLIMQPTSVPTYQPTPVPTSLPTTRVISNVFLLLLFFSVFRGELGWFVCQSVIAHPGAHKHTDCIPFAKPDPRGDSCGCVFKSVYYSAVCNLPT
jgi:hypothetical protein